MIYLYMLAMYIVIGMIFNYGSIFLIWGQLYRMCNGNQWKYNQLYKKHTQTAFDFTPGFPVWAKVIFTQLLWPFNVYNTVKCGLAAIREAKNGGI